jgi:dihydroflavonol-4-reductase
LQSPAIVDLTFPYVDVRDVAEAHVRAVENPDASGRYICSNELVSMRRTVDALSENGFGTYELPKMNLTSNLASAIVKQLARFQQPGSRAFIETNLGRTLTLDTSKIQDELGMEFRDMDTSIVETAHDLIAWDYVKRRD